MLSLIYRNVRKDSANSDSLVSFKDIAFDHVRAKKECSRIIEKVIAFYCSDFSNSAAAQTCILKIQRFIRFRKSLGDSNIGVT